MLNVIDNRLKFIKHIQNNFVGGVDVIIARDFYQTSFKKDSWIFQNIKNNVNALTSNFCTHMCNVMNYIKLCDNLIWSLLPKFNNK
jgi:hypothetical protein